MSEKFKDFVDKKDMWGGLLYLVSFALSVSIANYWQLLISKNVSRIYPDNIWMEIVFGLLYTLFAFGAIYGMTRLTKITGLFVVVKKNGGKKR